ncbi:nuclear pore complex protein Nup153 isoform X3 [Lampris incognitus]|uniref:nuclear pore complex protein Nup153 isoform X3 n=1 Tax=Lampris incognitus TaxID=2546036 RepID=UPI0024B62871|nr:nuclear pore complex protein Nup153 isoform X3 [Lampris incognitus]
MAATGGGKIRSRRYHIASKPYAKSKQQQPGLISRVTDTVKSIVPSWLHKYFNNGQPIQEEGVVQDAEQNSKPCPPPPPNGSEEGPPPIDGRDSPEPRTSNTEPSTSRVSLNFQENALPRPPLNRSHLNFTPLDASSSVLGGSVSFFSQPSTSSAPGPFSTGFSLVKEIKDNLSQHEDDNISTTSGFSSRASDKDVPTSKTASIPQLWSPETDRTMTGPQSAQSSLKKPAFNLSVFGTSANSTLNSQLGDSPYYPGKTTYGGASATKSYRSRPSTPYQAPVRRQIKAKPAGAQPCGVTSATARRILQSLERMSSPLADAKRIPSAASSPMSVSMDGTNLDFAHPLSKKKRLDSSLPPVQKLTVPAAASVSWNRSVSFRPSLTPGGVGRSLDRTPRDTPTRQLPHIPEAAPGPSQSTTSSGGPVYPMSSTPVAGSTSTGGGKMKRERTSTRPSTRLPEDDKVTEMPDLPPISLPISSFSLPTFSFSSPPPTTSTIPNPAPRTTTITPAKDSTTDKEPPSASTPPCVPFTFSSPIVKATAASPPSFSPSGGFTFSEPVAKMGPSMSNGKLATPIVAAVKSTINNSTEEFEGPFKPAKTLKQGSVLDLLKAPGFASPSSSGPVTAAHQTSTESTNPTSTSTSSSSSSSSTGFGDLFKPPAGSLNCNVCLVQNKPSDTKCVSPKPSSSSSASAFKQLDNKQKSTTSAGLENSSANNTTSTTTASGYGTMFAKSSGTWECDTCLVQNKAKAIKCVACETVKLSPAIPSAFLPVKTVSNPATPASSSTAAGIVGFGDKFKKPEGVWECSTCLVANKASDTKCVACMSAKPGASTGEPSSSAPPPATSSAAVLGFGDKFKKPENAWECDVCSVLNTAADLMCVACQSAKPGAKVEPIAFGSSTFGTSGSSAFGTSASGSGGFKFGLSSDSNSGSGGFKFGGSLSDSSSSSSGGFKFGVPSGSSLSETNSKDTTGSSGFKFGGSTEGFKFGVDSIPPTASDNKNSDLASTSSGFKFGASSGIAFGSGSSSVESNSSKGSFTFGLSKPEDKMAATTTLQASSVTFSLPTSSEEKGDSVALSTDTTSSTTITTSVGSVFSRLVEPSMTTATPSGGPTFSSLSTEKEPAAPTFTFGKPEEKKKAAPSSFLFSSAGKEAEGTQAPATLGGFPFSKPDLPKENPPPPPFGKPADKSETPPPEVPKPSLAFGQGATDTAAPKSAFSFNAATTSSSPAPSLFGTGSNSTQAPAPNANPAPSTFIFGQAASSSGDATPAKTFVFGQSQDNQPPAPSAPSLNSNPAPAAAQPFLFGAPANAAPAAATPPFTFEAAVPSAASTSAPSAAPSPFVFSSAPSGGFVASQTPSFGNSFGSQAPAFGVKPNAAPIFGQQANSTPVFGASGNSAPGGGFQFGGASAFGAVTNNTGVFAFGAGASGSPAPSANHPIAPQPAAPGGGFNFSQTPTFNLGSTKSSFTSSPAGQQSITGRKIKTAVRRRK